MMWARISSARSVYYLRVTRVREDFRQRLEGVVDGGGLVGGQGEGYRDLRLVDHEMISLG